MRFYNFHVGDYAAATRHLSLLEDLAYRRLIDWVYVHEDFPVGTPDEIARKVGMREHVAAVAAVLEEFFTLQDGAWRHSRCEQEIQRYRDQVEAGKLGARKRWSK
jgi:uncharacterized protein YdaU (DUF1376 family)